MPDPVFFKPAVDLTLTEVAALVGAAPLAPEHALKPVRGLAAVDRAKGDELTFLENPHYLEALSRSRALACLVAEKNAARVPGEVIPLIVKDPYRAFAHVAGHLFPTATRPASTCVTPL